jgi:cytochrome c oxidase subunit 3
LATTETHVTGLAHQFEAPEQQQEAVGLGMWVFLITEIMFFGGLFAGYAVYRSLFPEAFIEGSHHLDIRLATLNTVVLIASSFTMALAVHAAQTGRRGALVAFLILTILLGATFLGVKVVEYSEKYTHHLVPVRGFFQLERPIFEDVDPSRVQLFLGFYFTMTGLHALHMIIGVGVLIALVVQAWRGKFSPEYNAPVDMTGLYWHFVDIVWIFLFPLLYLIGHHLE